MAAWATQYMARRSLQRVVAGGNRQWLQIRKRICVGYPARGQPEKRRLTGNTTEGNFSNQSTEFAVFTGRSCSLVSNSRRSRPRVSWPKIVTSSNDATVGM